MPNPSATGPITLVLSEEERTQLLNHLEQGQRDLLIEVHRTRAPGYREPIQRKQVVLQGLIERLKGVTKGTAASAMADEESVI